MLVHVINKHKPASPKMALPVPVTQKQESQAKLSKLEYNKFISSQPFKKGDVVISVCIKEVGYGIVGKHSVMKITDIQEIHYLAEYDWVGEPQCLQMKSVEGYLFWSSPRNWKLCPPEILERLELVEWSKQ